MPFNLMDAAGFRAKATGAGETSLRETFAEERRVANEEKAAAECARRATDAKRDAAFAERKAIFEAAFKAAEEEVVVPAEVSDVTADVLWQVYARSKLHANGDIRHFSEIHPAAWGADTITKRLPAWLFFADLNYICSWHNVTECTYGDACGFAHSCIACRGGHGVLDTEVPPGGGEQVFACGVMQELADAGFDVLEGEREMLPQIKTKGTDVDVDDAGAGAAPA